MKRLFYVLALCGLGACGADLTQPWEVKEPRLLGARVEVQGEPESSHPGSEEYFDVRMFVAQPKNTKSTSRFTAKSLKLVLCIGLKLPNGQLACSAEFDLDRRFPGATKDPEITVISDEEIRVDNLYVPKFEQPEADDDVVFDRLALFGVLCFGGEAKRVGGKSVTTEPVSQLFECADNDGSEFPDPETFTLSVLADLGRDGDQNDSPTFACEPGADASDACKAGVKVSGERTIAGEVVLVKPRPEGAAESTPRETLVWEPWPRTDRGALSEALPWRNCVDEPRLPKVRAGEENYEVRVRFDAGDRERYSYDAVVEGKKKHLSTREELLVAHAVTTRGGELERYFSVLEKDVPDGEAEIAFEYSPPGEEADGPDRVPEGGRLVRIYLLVRDQRGGVDYTSRELCLMPAMSGGSRV